MSEPAYILPPPPVLKVPKDAKLLSAVPDDADPRLLRIQALENWARLYEAEATRLLEELWREGRFSEDQLRAATGMSRMGSRKRADPVYRERVNQQRRRRRKNPPPDPGDST
ncbi:hypothetical protein [Streptomyces violaceusniger]|uniref:Uncharacterized protein n=1 Tax=Streptomyces violaceusniger (strain Tu 4113) TaxID=653045 RepID=G2PHU8_STRV4|nr:hypothetical protein [Streptomyces violaceusniger]AEM88899.1 hypothetical protein Strvi_0123 [Streptomyces violaceusniger Tu 4113]